MRLLYDREASLWLRDFIPDSDNFDWDKGNLQKNLKHKIGADEIESIFRQAHFVFAGRIVQPVHDEWRGLVLGRTDGGRPVALIFTRRGEKLRPISCRSMRPDERRFYEETED